MNNNNKQHKQQQDKIDTHISYSPRCVDTNITKEIITWKEDGMHEVSNR